MRKRYIAVLSKYNIHMSYSRHDFLPAVRIAHIITLYQLASLKFPWKSANVLHNSRMTTQKECLSPIIIVSMTAEARMHSVQVEVHTTLKFHPRLN